MNESCTSGIDPQTTAPDSQDGAPFNTASFSRLRAVEAWRKYDGVLSWGRGQCLAILDDGCDLADPAWQVPGKVAATWNSIDHNEDCRPVPPGYHGTTVGHPSSLNLGGVHGLAWANCVAHVRCVTVVHLRQDESVSIAAGLRWVRDNHQRLHITAVNLSPLDDQRHQQPVPTVVDAELRALQELNIWVSAPAGNNEYTDGISWPACQPDCVGVGATDPETGRVWKDRFRNLDLVVPAMATSSSNAYAAASAQVLQEAIAKTNFPWQREGDTLPQAMLRIFQRTGVTVFDPVTGLEFPQLDLLAALDYVFAAAGHHAGATA